jgi:hypothetical protein
MSDMSISSANNAVLDFLANINGIPSNQPQQEPASIQSSAPQDCSASDSSSPSTEVSISDLAMLLSLETEDKEVSALLSLGESSDSNSSQQQPFDAALNAYLSLDPSKC